MSAWTDKEPLDSHCPTLGEVGAAAMVVLGAICWAVVIVWSKRRPL